MSVAHTTRRTSRPHASDQATPAFPASLIAASVAACAVLLAVPAAAMDGEILINQTKVNAGGSTPGDAPGFPATLSRPGRYKLTGNLAVPPADGIQVKQHDITIDLNGFMIFSAPAKQAIRGINNETSTDGLRVRNGTIAGFQSWGIVAGRFAVIEDMRMINNGGGMFALRDSRISSNTIADSNGSGVICQERCLIEQNIISRSADVVGGAGLWLHSSGTVLGNLIVLSKDYGIYCSSAYCGYENNMLIGNNGGGPQVTSNTIPLHANACDPACP